ncbi:MAG TPA: dTDP-glucose 4,6-dehydratase [Bacillales bacterium]|nr:dTDP-glucose 4,6-dehydratase [Bacillales bacterium]
MYENILVTGGAGFIGVHFIDFFIKKYPGCKLVNLDKLTYASNKQETTSWSRKRRCVLVQGDINDRPLVERLFDQYDFDAVIHLAAESHVDRSIRSPDVFVDTNVRGTFTLLDVAKNHWSRSKGFKDKRFHHVSTDEVYGSLEGTGKFTEHSPYNPSSPYSASKAASDLLVASYAKTYGMNTVITHCSNNYGPKQHPEKLIPTIIRKALRAERIPIYGDGQNRRDWIYVLDHCKGIDMAFHCGRAGEAYNIGGNNEWTNVQVAEHICRLLDERCREIRQSAGLSSFRRLISFVKDREGHDRRYAVDISKLKRETGWQPETPFTVGLRMTVEWYVNEVEQAGNFDRNTRVQK